MAGIQLTGLASGLDSEAIISQLMAVERTPRTQMTLRQAREQARHDALADINGKLTSLKTAATALRSVATWADTQSASTSDDSRVAARRTGGAAAGGYEVEVQRLASAEQRTYAFSSPGSATTLSVNGQSIDLAAGATVDDAVAAINGNDSAGVYAVAVSGKLVLSSKTTGAAGSFTASGSALTEDVGALRAGQDAAYTIDGVAKTSSTNVIKDAVAGVELTLKAKTSGAVTLNVGGPAADPDAVVSAVKNYVSAYNTVIDAIRGETTEKVDPKATTALAAKAGALFGDSGLNSILTSLRGTLGGVSGIGISTGAASASVNQDAVNGKITFDETALRAAIANDPTAVKKALGGYAGVNGLAQAVEGVLEPLTQAGGVMDQRVTGSDTALSSMKDRLAAFDDRMTSRQDLLRKQFASLEAAMNRNTSLQSSLASMLG